MSILSQAVGKVSQSLGGQVTSALGQSGLGQLVSALARDDPEAPYHFGLEIDGCVAAHCKEVSGMKMTIELETPYREGGNNLYPHVMLKGAKWEPLTLKRGFFGKDTDMYAWMRQMMDPAKFKGTGFRTGKNMALIMMGNNFTERCRFEFYRAFPIEFSGPKLDATQKGQVAFEDIKIHYDYFEFVAGTLTADALGAAASAVLNLI